MSHIKIIYEDDFIIVVDKPAGLLTVATPQKEKITLSSLLNAYPAHRLDRDTSGLMVFAKTKKIQRLLMDEFRQRRVKKSYVAFVHGKINRVKGLISGYVKDNPFEGAKFAKTEYRLIERKKDFSIVKVMPITGRTNQIRIHFKQIGHPLLGERRFAFARDFKIKFRRTALHSQGLELFHPITGRKIFFHAALPKDMQNFLDTH